MSSELLTLEDGEQITKGEIVAAASRIHGPIFKGYSPKTNQFIGYYHVNKKGHVVIAIKSGRGWK